GADAQGGYHVREAVRQCALAPGVLHDHIDRSGAAGRRRGGDLGRAVDAEADAGHAAEGDTGGAGEARAGDRHDGAAGGRAGGRHEARRAGAAELDGPDVARADARLAALVEVAAGEGGAGRGVAVVDEIGGEGREVGERRATVVGEG